jgi:peptidoglycan LD-endopeptidase CwlK
MGIEIRWGGDWDGDGDLSDHKFNDLPHFELIDSSTKEYE